MEGTAHPSPTAVAQLPAGEDMKAYVIRRAFAVKQYQRVVAKTGVNFHWLRKLAKGRMPKPNYDDIRTLSEFYRRLELGLVSLED